MSSMNDILDMATQASLQDVRDAEPLLAAHESSLIRSQHDVDSDFMGAICGCTEDSNAKVAANAVAALQALVDQVRIELSFCFPLSHTLARMSAVWVRA